MSGNSADSATSDNADASDSSATSDSSEGPTSASAPEPPGGASSENADPEAVTLTCAPIVRSLLAPEFDDYYSDLLDLYEEDLTDDIVLNELADFFSDLLASGGPEALIERCCDAFEALCDAERFDPVTTLYDQVLLALSPRALERARPYFGPAVEALLSELEAH
ncbi:MAG: hypothetical protein ACLQK4_02720 [Acidimicrobiales bacterium]|jgi:hypothetical protein